LDGETGWVKALIEERETIKNSTLRIGKRFLVKIRKKRRRRKMHDYEEQMKRATINFESVKIAIRQDKNGYILTLAVHPNDIPDSLLRDWVGSRYQVAMVLLNDQDEPVVPKNKTDGEKAVAKAGLLCRERGFQLFMADKHDKAEWELEGYGVEETAQLLRYDLNIKSRSELMDNKEAREKLEELLIEYGKNIGW
tara:strand:+ start:159 stop:743 length:585 start_codon:yes stop_codon:yes gene_type:complete